MLRTNLFLRCFCLFFITLFICSLLLFASELLPQESIDRHVSASVERLEFEGPYAYILDGRRSAMLDNYTDAIILTVCRSSHIGEPLSFLTNPMFDGDDPIGSLAAYCREGAEPDGHYVRYWLGFRIFLRPLLEFFTFRGIRFVMLGVLFVLTLLAVISVYKNVSLPAALAFGLSILLIRPYVVSRCMQFACCPLIAVSAMLFVPWAERDRRQCLPFFLVLGMLTMFFDFYTVPALTFGMPMIYYLTILAKKGEKLTAGTVLRCFGMWLLGYVLMWMAKLALTTLFTPYNGFSNSFSEFRLWTNRKSNAEPGQYTALKALAAVFRIICPDTLCKVIMGVLALVCAALMLWAFKTGRNDRLLRALPILYVGLLPLIWFAASARPIIVHTFFQYRSIAVLYWAVGAFVTAALAGRKQAELT